MEVYIARDTCGGKIIYAVLCEGDRAIRAAMVCSNGRYYEAECNIERYKSYCFLDFNEILIKCKGPCCKGLLASCHNVELRPAGICECTAAEIRRKIMRTDDSTKLAKLDEKITALAAEIAEIKKMLNCVQLAQNQIGGSTTPMSSPD